MFILGILGIYNGNVVISHRSGGTIIPKRPLLVVSVNNSVFMRLDNRP